MRVKTFLAAGLVAILAAAAGVYLVLPRLNGPTVAGDAAPLATPGGITLQRLGEFDSHIGMPSYMPRRSRKLAYADVNGMTLYTYDKDVASGAMSACTGDCAKDWPAAIAATNAKPAGEWSLLDRDDGAKQWARKGKRLYVSVKDKQRGEMLGDSADNGAWHAALFQPENEMALPKGMIAVKEVADAGGMALVDAEGLTLYAFSGDPNKDSPVCAGTNPCATHWIPFAAPQLANPVGDFSVASRKDGIKQWVYKGRALYRYDSDFNPEEANGIGLDKRWNVALVTRYFTPAEAGTIYNIAHGVILAAADGMTLYRQDGFTYEPGGHANYHSMPTRPVVGYEIGTKSCEGACLASWHPLKAPPNAESSGFWEVATRSDGTKQWIYQGYAQYTYAGDKKPGDMTGDDIYEPLIGDNPKKAVSMPIYQWGAGALFWTFTSP